MPPLKGLSDSSPDRLRSACTSAAKFSTPRSRQGVHSAVLALPTVLIAMCASSAQAQTTAVGDRYSGEVYVQPAYRQAASAGGPTLSWPGKTAAAEPQPAAPSPSSSGFGEQMRAPAYAYAPQAYRPAARAAYQTPVTQQVAQTPTYPPPAYPAQVARAPASPAGAYAAPPVMPWYQRYGEAAAPPAASPAPAPLPPAPPQSIYDPPAGQSGAATGASAAASSAAAMAPPTPTAAPTATAANDGETARFYSLHRQYGLTPDPDPIPPQFFTQTADLSDPPGPSAVYKATTSSGGSTTAAHVVQSDDPTSTLNQP